MSCERKEKEEAESSIQFYKDKIKLAHNSRQLGENMKKGEP